MKSNESGFGLVEIVISMFLFLLLAVAFLPLLINGMKVTASNATLATATQLAEQTLQQARQASPTCNAVKTVPAPHSVSDRGVTLTPVITAGSCPISYPGTVKLSVQVKNAATSEVVSEASTLILVKSAS